MNKGIALISQLPVTLLALALSGCSGLPDMGAGKRAMTTGDINQAQYHFQELAERGFPDAMVFLGDIYLRQEHYQQAQNNYKKGLDAGSQKALVRLARLYYRKNLGGVQPHKAETLLNQALQQDQQVVRDFARLYFEWPELLTNPERRQWFNRAIAAGVDEAWFYMAESLVCEGCPVSQIKQAADAYFKSIPVKPQAIKSLVTLYETYPGLGSLETLAEELEKRSLVSGQVYFALGNQYYEDSKREQAAFLARDYYQKAIENSYPKAWGKLLNLTLKHPEITNAEELDRWLAQAKDSGLETVDLWQARRLVQGVHTIVDPFKAEKLLKSLEAHYTEAAYRLGVLYLSGMLGEPDYLKAFELLERSGNQGLGEGYLKIAETLHYGRGIPRNPEKAHHYAKQAMMNGSDQAVYLLGLMGVASASGGINSAAQHR